jgi:hypothetical protein
MRPEFHLERKRAVVDYILHLKTEELAIVQQDRSQTVRMKQEKFLVLYYNNLLKLYNKWVEEDTIASLWLSVMFAVGCRKTAVAFSDIEFKPLTDIQAGKITNSSRWIRQIGVLKDANKRSGGASLRVVIKPILFNTTSKEIEARVDEIRSRISSQMNTLHAEWQEAIGAYNAKLKDGKPAKRVYSMEERITNRWGPTLVSKMDTDFIQPFMDHIWSKVANKTHVLRSVYAVTAYEQFQESIGRSQAGFIATVLGHDTEHSASAYSNVKIRWGWGELDDKKVDFTKGFVKERLADLETKLSNLADAASQQRSPSPDPNPPAEQVADPAVKQSWGALVRAAKEAQRDHVTVVTDDGESIDIKFNDGRYKSNDKKRQILDTISQLKKAKLSVSKYRFSQLGYSRNNKVLREVWAEMAD